MRDLLAGALLDASLGAEIKASEVSFSTSLLAWARAGFPVCLLRPRRRQHRGPKRSEFLRKNFKNTLVSLQDLALYSAGR